MTVEWAEGADPTDDLSPEELALVCVLRNGHIKPTLLSNVARGLQDLSVEPEKAQVFDTHLGQCVGCRAEFTRLSGADGEGL